MVFHFLSPKLVNGCCWDCNLVDELIEDEDEDKDDDAVRGFTVENEEAPTSGAFVIDCCLLA